MRSLEECVLGGCVSVFCTVCITLLIFIRKFIYSKPPGRIMVSKLIIGWSGFCVLYTETWAFYTCFCALFTENFCSFFAKGLIFIWNPDPKFCKFPWFRRWYRYFEIPFHSFIISTLLSQEGNAILKQQFWHLNFGSGFKKIFFFF